MSYTSPEVCKRAGVTYRQLHYWCSKGFVPGQPRRMGIGNHRRFTAEQVEVVKALRAKMASRLHGLSSGGRRDLKARQRALVRLKALHPDDFRRLLVEEYARERESL